MWTPWDDSLVSARRSRRSESRRPRFAQLERLEARCLLDAGGSGTDLAPPTTFASGAEFRQYLIDSAVERVRSLLGTSVPAPGPGGPWTFVPVALQVPTSAAATSSPTHSDTNNQVQGVDEGDVVENDGNSLFILSGQDLKIVDARNPQALTIASSTAIDGRPIAEYLNGTRLTILSSSGGYFDPGTVDTLPGGGFGWGIGGGVGVPIAAMANVAAAPAMLPVGAPVDPGFTSPLVKVTELDVSNPAAPSVVRQTTLDGIYVNSRAVGDQVYVILQNPLPPLPGPQTHTDGTQAVYETEAEYRARLAPLVAAITLPQFSSQATGQAGASGDQLAFASIYKPETSGEQSLFTVLSFDAGRPAAGPAAAVGVVASSATTVYATPEHLDLFSPQWPVYGPLSSSSSWQANTLIRRFTLDGDDIALSAVGSVPGTVLNQYSVDEQGSYLRVATTETATTTAPSSSLSPLSNSIYVLAEQQGRLSVVGSLTGVAPGERIYATRFFGDRAYIVTFRQFDPLFAIDLADPTAPKLAGSLEIPGFSRYLQLIDATHIIGIGQQVANNEPSNVQVSLFDVSDLANPRRVDVTTVSTGDSYWMTTSEHYDAHQVFYDAGTQTLAIPINGYSASGGTQDRGTLLDALWVFKVDPAQGLTQLGHVDAARPVARAVSIGDVLFSISLDAVKAVPIGDPATTLGQVQIRDPNDIPPSWGWGGILWPIVPIIGFVPTPVPPTPAPPAKGETPAVTPSPQPAPIDPGPGPTIAPAAPPGDAGGAAPPDPGLDPASILHDPILPGGKSDSSGVKVTRGRHHHPRGPRRFHTTPFGTPASQANHPRPIGLSVPVIASRHHPGA